MPLDLGQVWRLSCTASESAPPDTRIWMFSDGNGHSRLRSAKVTNPSSYSLLARTPPALISAPSVRSMALKAVAISVAIVDGPTRTSTEESEPGGYTPSTASCSSTAGLSQRAHKARSCSSGAYLSSGGGPLCFLGTPNGTSSSWTLVGIELGGVPADQTRSTTATLYPSAPALTMRVPWCTSSKTSCSCPPKMHGNGRPSPHSCTSSGMSWWVSGMMQSRPSAHEDCARLTASAAASMTGVIFCA
mmetsp:Transcript_1186/g.3548  ORF Transcript_1186/g.3548 Transcript_1186/m.3548 type:complete len:246 (-) Transcript_1186:459-1196(-)